MYIRSLPNPSNVNFAYFVPIVKVTYCKQYKYERSREECYNGHLMNQMNILRKKLRKNVGILIQDTVIIRRSSSLDYHNYQR